MIRTRLDALRKLIQSWALSHHPRVVRWFRTTHGFACGLTAIGTLVAGLLLWIGTSVVMMQLEEQWRSMLLDSDVTDYTPQLLCKDRVYISDWKYGQECTLLPHLQARWGAMPYRFFEYAVQSNKAFRWAHRTQALLALPTEHTASGVWWNREYRAWDPVTESYMNGPPAKIKHFPRAIFESMNILEGQGLVPGCVCGWQIGLSNLSDAVLFSNKNEVYFGIHEISKTEKQRGAIVLSSDDIAVQEQKMILLPLQVKFHAYRADLSNYKYTIQKVGNSTLDDRQIFDPADQSTSGWLFDMLKVAKDRVQTWSESMNWTTPSGQSNGTDEHACADPPIPEYLEKIFVSEVVTVQNLEDVYCLHSCGLLM